MKKLLLLAVLTLLDSIPVYVMARDVFICKPDNLSDTLFVLVQYKTGTEPAPTIFVDKNELGNADKNKALISTDPNNTNLYLIDCNTIDQNKFKDPWEDRDKPRLDNVLLSDALKYTFDKNITDFKYKVDLSSRTFFNDTNNINNIIKTVANYRQEQKEPEKKQNNIFICKPTSPSDDPFVLVQYKTGTEPAPTIFVDNTELGNADMDKTLITKIDGKDLYLIDCNTIAADKFKGAWEDRDKPRLDKILLEQRIIEGTGTTTSMTYKIDETSRNFLKTNIIMIIKEFQLEQFQQEQLKKQREQEEKLAKELLEQNRLLKESEKKREQEKLEKEKLAVQETKKTNQLVYDLALAFRKLG